jgi:uncharacterized membrane protein (DUF4010 family)
MGEIENLLPSLLTALGLGLLIGTVRERQQAEALAGVRTHALAALLGAIAFHLGPPVFLVMLGLLVGLVLIGYWRSSVENRGLTSEIALLLTALLGALAMVSAILAAALGVVAAALLYAKASLHRFTRELLSEREVHDGLILLASALIILPLIPNHAVGPYASFNPALIWRLVVLVMAISALGHVSLRVIGNRWGLAVAGFFAGYVSSTAAIAGFGQRVKESPTMLRPAVGAAMFSNLASLSLFAPVLLAVAPPLLPILAPQLLAACTVLLIGGLLGVRGGESSTAVPPTADSRMFRIGQVLMFALAITAVLFISAALNAWLGPRGALIAPMLTALAELHAAIASIGQLFQHHVLDAEQARWSLLGLLAMSVLAKSIVAVATGGRAYGLRVAAGLLVTLAAVLAVLLLMPRFA